MRVCLRMRFNNVGGKADVPWTTFSSGEDYEAISEAGSSSTP